MLRDEIPLAVFENEDIYMESLCDMLGMITASEIGNASKGTTFKMTLKEFSDIYDVLIQSRMALNLYEYRLNALAFSNRGSVLTRLLDDTYDPITNTTRDERQKKALPGA